MKDNEFVEILQEDGYLTIYRNGQMAMSSLDWESVQWLVEKLLPYITKMKEAQIKQLEKDIADAQERLNKLKGEQG